MRARRKAGIMSQAPAKKQTAPTKVPPLAQAGLMAVSVLGSTYAATAEAMKAIEPAMLSQAMRHPAERGRHDRTGPGPATAYALDARNRTEP